jgi:hypothetical protein
MKSIILTDQEARDLQEFYYQELEKTRKKLGHLTGVLQKLGVDEYLEMPAIAGAKGKKARLAESKGGVGKKGTELKGEPMYNEAGEIIGYAPRKRGRPRKERTPEEEIIEAEKKQRREESRLEAERLGIVRKRGRPRKMVVEGEEPAPKVRAPKKVALDENGNPIEQPSRKRGRPRKEADEKAEKKAKRGRPKKRGRKKVRKPVVRKTGKKGLKSVKRANWTEFVLDSMSEFEKPFSSKELLNLAIERLEIPSEMHEKSRMSIAACLSNLASKRGKVKIFSMPDSKTQVYGLPEWFNENGDLAEAFVQKLQ